MQFSIILIHSEAEEASGTLAWLVLGLHALTAIHEAVAAGHVVTRPSSFKVLLVFSSNSSLPSAGGGVRVVTCAKGRGLVRMRQGVGLQRDCVLARRALVRRMLESITSAPKMQFSQLLLTWWSIYFSEGGGYAGS